MSISQAVISKESLCIYGQPGHWCSGLIMHKFTTKKGCREIE